MGFFILFCIICFILYYHKKNEERKNAYSIKEFNEKYKDEIAVFEKNKVF